MRRPLGVPIPTSALLGAVALALPVWGLSTLWMGQAVSDEADSLVSTAREAAAEIDATSHGALSGSRSADFADLVRHLREVKDRHDLTTEIYTLRREGDHTVFVGMTNARPFPGEIYTLRPEMRAVFERQVPATTGVYRSETGWWISGFAPILAPDGSTQALVSVDRHAEDFRTWRTRNQLAGATAALFGFVLGWILPLVMRSKGGVVTALRQLLFGSLSLRIGLSGALAVVAAVGMVGWLDHRVGSEELLNGLEDRLLTAVMVGAPALDGDLHERAASEGVQSAAFLDLRDQLRGIRENASLESPVYTFRRDGNLVRFVVMTNEIPYFGDPYELRAGVRRTFEHGEPGVDGPYVDAHGTWISAWAPIRDSAGTVVGVLQADFEVGLLLDQQRTRAYSRGVFGLMGCFVAFGFALFTARSVANPIGSIARAAKGIQAGNLQLRVDESRLDEVGVLSRAINDMTRGLQERESIREAFGKYIAPEVVSQLIENGELSMDGQLKSITVIESDIRGFTPLTESMKACELVDLLNEYFSMLVEEVVKEGGHVDKFMGDAMLALFGAPVPHEDSPARALRAAASMLERLERWNEDRISRGLLPVHTGIGVATGRVVVGNIGSPAHKIEYTAIGEAVNIAARLCSSAEPGVLVVSEEVWQSTEDPRFSLVGPRSVKGVSEPIIVYEYRRGAIA